ncbi:MAG: DUF1501 domain-containing protein [Isosphaeraceae bacterium]
MNGPGTIGRRALIRAGSLGLMGLGLPGLLRARALAPTSADPRARSVLYLFLSGGASQLETFDLKPDAPAEVRGEFKPIPTNVPGIDICEHLPMLASRADRLRWSGRSRTRATTTRWATTSC